MESATGPGETYGRVAIQAKQMAVNKINAAGGVDGRMLELVVEDSKCSAQDAITAYNRLTSVDGVRIILGTSCSGAMLGAAPLAERDGVMLFSGLATNPDIADAGDYILRTSLSDAQRGIDTGNVLWADGVRTLATITEATDYAEGVRRTSVAQFEARGGEVVAMERYPSDTTDFRTQLTKLIEANPDALHVAAQSEFTGGTVIKQARELGYEGPIYGEDVAVGTTALEIAGDAATGVKAIILDIDPTNERGLDVLERFRANYGYVTRSWYLASAYDDVYITAECLGETGDDRTPTASATASTGSRTAAPSARATASTRRARWSASRRRDRGAAAGGAHRAEPRLSRPRAGARRVGADGAGCGGRDSELAEP